MFCLLHNFFAEIDTENHKTSFKFLASILVSKFILMQKFTFDRLDWSRVHAYLLIMYFSNKKCIPKKQKERFEEAELDWG